FGSQAGNREQGRVGQPWGGFGEDDRTRCLSQAAFQTVPQVLRSGRIERQRAKSRSNSRSKADNSSDVLRAGAMAELLTAATKQRLNPLEALSCHQGAHPLGTTDLVRGKRNKVDT